MTSAVMRYSLSHPFVPSSRGPWALAKGNEMGREAAHTCVWAVAQNLWLICVGCRYALGVPGNGLFFHFYIKKNKISKIYVE